MQWTLKLSIYLYLCGFLYLSHWNLLQHPRNSLHPLVIPYNPLENPFNLLKSTTSITLISLDIYIYMETSLSGNLRLKIIQFSIGNIISFNVVLTHFDLPKYDLQKTDIGVFFDNVKLTFLLAFTSLLYLFSKLSFHRNQLYHINLYNSLLCTFQVWGVCKS